MAAHVADPIADLRLQRPRTLRVARFKRGGNRRGGRHTALSRSGPSITAAADRSTVCARRRQLGARSFKADHRSSRSTRTRPRSMTSDMRTGEVSVSESRISCISRPVRRESRSVSSAKRLTAGSRNTTNTSTSERSSSAPIAVEPNSTASLTLGSVRNDARSARNNSQWLRRYASSRNVIRNRRGLRRSPCTRPSDAARRSVRAGISSSDAARPRESTLRPYRRMADTSSSCGR